MSRLFFGRRYLVSRSKPESFPSPLFLVVDAPSFTTGAFHSTPQGITRASDGLPLNAAFTCTVVLRKLLRLAKPTQSVLVTGPCRPHTEAKAAAQVGLVGRAAASLGITTVTTTTPTDLTASYATTAAMKGLDVLVVSSDKALQQVIGPRVRLYDSVTELVLDEAEILRRMNVPPVLLPDLQALIGDPIGNIPGVPGIGIKTASKLVTDYGGVEGLFRRLEELKPAGRRELLAKHRQQIMASMSAYTISRNAELPVPLSALDRRDPGRDQLLLFLEEMGFTSLITQIVQEDFEEEGEDRDRDRDREKLTTKVATATVSPSSPLNSSSTTTTTTTTAPLPVDPRHRALSTAEEVSEWVAACGRAEAVGVAAMTDDGQGSVAGDEALLGLALSTPDGEGRYIPASLITEEVRSLLTSMDPPKAVHNLKPLMKLLRLPASPAIDDTMVQSYVLDCGRYQHGPLASVAEAVLRCPPPLSLKDVVSRVGRSMPKLKDAPHGDVARVKCAEAGLTLRLREALGKRLLDEGMRGFYETLERPLVDTLAAMESHGVMIDSAALRDMAATLEARKGKIEQRVFELAGKEFLIHSPKQLGEVLFDERKVGGDLLSDKELSAEVKKSPKTGLWTTGSEVLKRFADRGAELPKLVLEFRATSKLHSTYAKGLVDHISPETGRVHTVFHNALTTTGRLSSVNPNLQNIPNRTEEGRLVRRAFIAPPGKVLLSVDYSQVELRILAHMAKVPALQDAFLRGTDVHTVTASQVFGVPLDKVDKATRHKAKAVNFGIVYGVSEYGLSAQLGVSVRQAKDFIASYFARYPGIKDYLDSTVALCRRNSYVFTLFGRKCWVPDINSPVPAKRGFAERASINAPIQGTSADITKLAMNSLHAALPARRLSARTILQVHDELVFEVPEPELEESKAVIKAIMEGVVQERGMDFSVPLPVDLKSGKNWAET